MTSAKRIFPVLSLISALLLGGCGGSRRSENALSEGVIEYNAAVVDETHPMAGLAPSTATVRFKNNKYELEMSTMGFFNTMFVSDPGKKTLTQMVKFMDLKNACIQTEAELMKENRDYELNLQETKETKKIAGYNCKKVKASLVNNPAVSFDVYYTEDLGMDSINQLSPYRQIKGMLMQYRLKKLGLEMSFTATSVKKEEIKEETFEVPSYYKIVTRSEMEKLFADIQK